LEQDEELVITTANFFEKIRGGLIVSCYANNDYNQPFKNPEAMRALATSVAQGGASAIRVNLMHVAALKRVLNIPIYGIEKIYRNGEMRITPTLGEVKALVKAGADAIAIDATHRQRFDGLTLEEFIKEIKRRFDIPVLGDISTYEEGARAVEWGIDGVSSTLSGYTQYSQNYGKLGDIPTPEPDYALIERLRASFDIPIIAEGRLNTPEKIRQAFLVGAHAVVVGTAISNPQKLTEWFSTGLH
jgi:N-acylglucosamine-6-phosphate 2-epimerase